VNSGVAPVPGAVVGAHFGEYGSWSRYHTGLDFRAGYGTPIRAVKAGTVLYAGNSGDWAGNHVAIKHADGMTTMSSHMSSMAVRAGQTVRAGQVIGYVGQTGRAFGAHLHFELYPAGVKYGDVYKAINPQSWLAANGVTTH
jgi:murein DD-endopeptidase MepM/ murein hydrolase activator NlpD